MPTQELYLFNVRDSITGKRRFKWSMWMADCALNVIATYRQSLRPPHLPAPSMAFDNSFQRILTLRDRHSMRLRPVAFLIFVPLA